MLSTDEESTDGHVFIIFNFSLSLSNSAPIERCSTETDGKLIQQRCRVSIPEDRVWS